MQGVYWFDDPSHPKFITFNELSMILFNLKIASRNIWKNRTFSAVNILGLALSMCSCLVIGLYIWNEWQVDRFHTNFQSIYRITEKQNQAGSLYSVAVTPGPLAPKLLEDFPQIKNAVRMGSWSGTLRVGDKVFQPQPILLTENSFFKIFDFPLVKGNASKALTGPDEIIITERVADQYFGDEWRTDATVIGKVFRLNNETDFRLAGIARNPPANSSIQFDVLLPLQWLLSTDKWSNQWNSNNYHTYIQLAATANAGQLESTLSKQLTKYNPETQDELRLQKLADQYLHSTFDFQTDWGKRSDIRYIRIFAGVGILLLIMACVNFINLATARSIRRSMEVGVRKVNGATRIQLIRQFLSESMLMSLIAAAAGLFLYAAIKPWLEKWVGIDMNPLISVGQVSLLFLAFVLIIGLLAGLYPALLLSAHAPSKVLRGTIRRPGGIRSRQVLVVAQFAISVILITSTFFMYRQLKFIQTKDLGFNQDELLTLRLGGAFRQNSAPFKQEVQKLAGVRSTSAATMSMVNVSNSSYVEWEGMAKDDKFLLTQSNVDPGFIPTLGLKLLSGTNFSPQRSNDTVNFIVNESAVKRMGYTTDNALGKKVNFWGANGQIIGVVKDFHFKPLSTQIEPFIFRYQPQDPYFTLFVKIDKGRAKQVLAAIQAVYRKYEKEVPFDYTYLSESIRASYESERRTVNIIVLFAGLTIFVGCLGLFGLAVFSAEQRVREIGIRKVLGAGVRSITLLLTRDFLKLVMVAIIIGVPFTIYAVSQWLENYAYRIDQSWTVYAWSGALVLALAFITVSAQAIRSAMANPAKNLKEK